MIALLRSPLIISLSKKSVVLEQTTSGRWSTNVLTLPTDIFKTVEDYAISLIFLSSPKHIRELLYKSKLNLLELANLAAIRHYLMIDLSSDERKIFKKSLCHKMSTGQGGIAMLVRIPRVCFEQDKSGARWKAAVKGMLNLFAMDSIHGEPYAHLLEEIRILETTNMFPSEEKTLRLLISDFAAKIEWTKNSENNKLFCLLNKFGLINTMREHSYDITRLSPHFLGSLIRKMKTPRRQTFNKVLKEHRETRRIINELYRESVSSAGKSDLDSDSDGKSDGKSDSSSSDSDSSSS